MAQRATHSNSVSQKLCLPYMRIARHSRLFCKDLWARTSCLSFSAVAFWTNNRSFWKKSGSSIGERVRRTNFLAVRKYILMDSCTWCTTSSKTGASQAASKSKWVRLSIKKSSSARSHFVFLQERGCLEFNLPLTKGQCHWPRAEELG